MAPRMALFVMAVLLAANVILSDAYSFRSSSSSSKMDIAQAPSRRLLQSDFCQSPPPCPITSVRNITCAVGGVTGTCECYYLGRCFPDAHGCYLLNGPDKTFCGF